LARLDYYRVKQRELNERRKPQYQEWLAANRDRKKAWWSRYYEENREQILARGKSYYQANRERFYAANALRRVRVRDGWHQLDAVDKQIVRFFYKAARKRGLAVDHIYPLDLGGEHAPWNLQLLTGKANSAKHNNEPTEREVVRGKRRYRLLRRQFERAANLGATA
jgi:5-methylcytosine-specific restriction endonuclease McrA